MKESVFICNYSSDFVLGGIESYYIRMFQWAKNHGYQNMLILPQENNVCDAWHEKLSELNVKIGHHNNAYFDFKVVGENKENIRFSSDLEGIIVVADIFGYMKMQRLKEKYKLHCIKIVLYIFQVGFCRASKKKWVNFPYLSIMKKLFNEGMVFMDEDTLTFCEKFYKYKLDRNKIIRLGLEIDDLPVKMIQRRVESRRKDFTILTITRLDFPFKAYVLGLIDVFENLKDKYSNLKLVVIGDGTGMEKLKKRVEELPEEKRKDVFLKGAVPYEELEGYFKKSHVYTGMGTTLLDAGKYALPGIISKADCEKALTTGFFHEQYNDLSGNENINHVSLSEMEIFLEKIIKISDEEYWEYSKRVYEIVLRHYGIDSSMKKILNLHENVNISWIKGFFLHYYGIVLRKIKKLGWG